MRIFLQFLAKIKAEIEVNPEYANIHSNAQYIDMRPEYICDGDGDDTVSYTYG